MKPGGTGAIRFVFEKNTSSTKPQNLDSGEGRFCHKRRPDRKDARTKRVFLTQQAHPVLDEMYSLADDVLGAAISGLSKPQIVHLMESLLHVKSNLADLLNNNNGRGTAER